MKNFTSFTSFALILGFSLAAPDFVYAQAWMPDSSSTTLDMWSDDTQVYAYGFTYGSSFVHTYSVDVQIESSLGVILIVPGGELQGGTVSTFATMPWDFFDDGVYITTSVHRGFCLSAQLAFTLAYVQFQKRPGNKPPCADGVTASSCNDGNTLPPTGRRLRWSCKEEQQCCKAGGAVAPGWCRKERCEKSGGQSTDAQPSGCTSRLACQDGTIAVYCGGL